MSDRNSRAFPSELIPPQAVAIGEDETSVPSGHEGTHRDVKVTVMDGRGESDTFTATVQVETSDVVDVVRIENAPEHLGVEKLGLPVELTADPVADGGYIWQEHSVCESDGQRIVLSQYIPCAICRDIVTSNVRHTTVGVVCRVCAYHIGDGDAGGDGR